MTEAEIMIEVATRHQQYQDGAISLGELVMLLSVLSAQSENLAEQELLSIEEEL